ncbi:ExeM/NucH family extracellular endonuclease [soil metagenome]
MSSVRKRIGLGLSLAVAATGISGFVAVPAEANPGGTGLVINEVYGGGGNSGAPYNADFVELYNPTNAAISLAGRGLQYRSSSGGSGGVATLSGSVPAKKTFLIEVSSGSTGAAINPDLKTSTTLNMSATNGQVLLLTSATAFTGSGNLAGASGVIDAVGFGSATSYEGGGPTGSPSNSTSVQRKLQSASGDTDNNAADFAAPTSPSPTASGSSGPTDPPPSGSTVTIAEVQGTGAVSPLAGQTVTTQGVVTAAYPTGGLNGFYLQTAATGGASDATPGASDAVFVYSPSLGAAEYPAIGSSIEVTGGVSEFAGSTEITATTSGISAVTPALTSVTPLATAYPTTEAAREANEGELLAPSDTFTVSNTYSTNQYAEIGLATGTKPLIQPTEVADAQDTAAVAAVQADNLARGVVLDDAASINFLTGADKDTALPWLSKTKTVSVGARATFTSPVILEYRNSVWKFQPRSQVTGNGSTVATFSDVRAANEAPADVGGDVTLATFNVLNYFPTTGEEFVADGGSCSYYTDRAGNRITDNQCTPDGPRGAANSVNLERQQTKIVTAINKLDADVVSLEEIENSVKFGKDRDFALQALVNALNADAGAGTWAFAPSPQAADLPATSAQDVIRNAFIYRPAQVSLVGASQVLTGSSAFSNARQPLAQAFKKAGAPDTDAFAVIVNHFKSKGSGTDDGTGQGLSNPDRVAQATDLTSFADSFATSRGTEKVFLTGDFNAYSQEDPMQVLYNAGYTDLRATFDPDTATYSFSGLSGSLDHVLANDAALGDVTDADVWSINSGEAIAYEYSRYNYNLTDFYSPDQFRASDHDPLVVGLDLAGTPAVDPVKVNLLNINDFHGRIDSNTTKFATTIEQLRAAEGEGSTLFLSSGDNIGASLFASAVAKDQPTIDVLNALALDASAVGNHEFDQGYADLTGRVTDAADWDYLGANVYQKDTLTPALPEYATFEVNGVTVGVIGAVTEETPSLVSPSGVAGLDFGDPVAAVNRVATQLSDGNDANGEADVIVAEYHEGAGASLADDATCDQEIAADTVFGDLARSTSADVDVIFTGHTHKSYTCDGPVPGSPNKTRPILQTGEYGNNIGQVKLSIDPATGSVTAYTQRNVARAATEDLSFPRVQQVKTITDAALANASAVGDTPVGKISQDITTAYTGGTFVNGRYTGGSRDDRASESTLGDLVAQALKQGVSDFATPDLGITNPGGLRAELLYAADTSSNPQNTDGVVTFAEANAVLPFNNTVAIVKLTGAQIKAVLEQQWQTNPDGSVPSRPYLQLGLSENVRVTTNPAAAAGNRITSVRIDNQLIDPAKTYTVSTLSFLATGGDNFRAFTTGTYTDTGLLDAQLWRDYLADETTDEGAVSPDFARQQVAAPGLPTSVVAAQQVSFSLNGLNLTSQGSPANQRVRVFLDNGSDQVAIGTFAVNASGTASVSFRAPANLVGSYDVGIAAEPSSTRVGVGGVVPAAPSVAGTVTDKAGAPVAGACVYLYPAGDDSAAAFASCTSADGTYYVSATAGSYDVVVNDPTGDHKTTRLPQPVTVSGPTSGIDVVLDDPAAAKITGVVIDSATADPAANVCVFAYPSGSSQSASYATCSAADGTYGLFGLAAGSYDVAFADPVGGYVTQWYNGTANGAATQAGATAVVLATPQSASTVDAALSAITTCAVSGTVTKAGGAPAAGVCVYLYTDTPGPSTPAQYGTCTQSDGTYYLPEVAPGTSYKVAFADPSGQLATQWWTGSTGGAAGYAGGVTIAPVVAGGLVSGIDAQLASVL